MITRALGLLMVLTAVAVLIPRLPAHVKETPKQCLEIKDELIDAVERGQLTWAQVQPIIKRCEDVEFE